MKELIIFFYYLFSLALAWTQGGFWWIVLNVCLPIAPFIKLAEIINKL